MSLLIISYENSIRILLLQHVLLGLLQFTSTIAKVCRVLIYYDYNECRSSSRIIAKILRNLTLQAQESCILHSEV